MITFAVTVRRGGGTDSWGDPRTPTMHTVERCIRWPRTSSEFTDRSDSVSTGWMLVVPVGADLLATDEVQMPGDAADVWWQVEGDPLPYVSPLSGWAPGTPVALTRTRG